MARLQISELIGLHSSGVGTGRLCENIERLEDRALLATLHWQGDLSANWGTAGNWQENSAPTGAYDILIFDSTTTGFNSTVGGTGFNSTNNLGSSTNIGGITFNQGGFTLGGTGNIDLTDTGVVATNTSGTNTISFSFRLNTTGTGADHTINVATGGTLAISGVISNSDSTDTLTKTGGGTLVFSGSSANTYSSLTTVSAGELDLNKTAGTDAITGNLTVSGGTAKLQQSNQLDNSISIVVTSGTLDIGANSDTVTGE